MEIRDAAAQDAHEIAIIWNNEIENGLGTFASTAKSDQDIVESIKAKQSAGHGFLVCKVGGKAAGFAMYGQFRASNGYAKTMEHTIYLAEFAHGKGVGRALMAALEDHARGFGAHSMLAGISAENAGSVTFHLKLGYREIARLPEVGHKSGQWLDLVLMQKFL